MRLLFAEIVGTGFSGVISFGPISTERTARLAASRGLFLSMKHFYRLLSFCFHYRGILPAAAAPYRRIVYQATLLRRFAIIKESRFAMPSSASN